MFNILLVEDDDNLRRLMATVLRRSRFNVIQAANGKDAIDLAENNHIDLMVCDIMLPEADGYEVTRSIREFNESLPVIMVTALETLDDKRKGFLSGADDYMVKPIDTDELIMRINALLRRAKATNERRITIGTLEIDMDSMTANYDGNALALPKKEFFLLFKFMSMPNHIFTRSALIEELWRPDSDSDERTVDVHIKRLRERLDEAGVTQFEIVTVRGLGYKLIKHV
ncbi:MAG: response regulator transcription factor [Clostridiales bacterium]|nr:response regulator transcription factor [Clostridiales bacterium]